MTGEVATLRVPMLPGVEHVFAFEAWDRARRQLVVMVGDASLGRFQMTTKEGVHEVRVPAALAGPDTVVRLRAAASEDRPRRARPLEFGWFRVTADLEAAPPR